MITFRDATAQSQTTDHYGSLRVMGAGGGPSILYAVNQANTGKIAVYGYSKPSNGYTSSGGQFEGNYVGVRGYASTSNGVSSYRYGGYFVASGGTYNRGVYASAPTGDNSYAGLFSGNIGYTGGLIKVSDMELKEDIVPLDGMLSKVMRLKPKSYTFDKKQSNLKEHLPEGKEFGLIAQDVEVVFPEIVSLVTLPTSPGEEDTNGNAESETVKAVDYVALVPILISAIQEQQHQIEELRGLLKK